MSTFSPVCLAYQYDRWPIFTEAQTNKQTKERKKERKERQKAAPITVGEDEHDLHAKWNW